MTKLRRILRNNVITGAAGLSILVALFWLTGRHPELPFPVGLLFAPHCFYLWTILHIAFSSRLADLDFWIPPPPQES